MICDSGLITIKATAMKNEWIDAAVTPQRDGFYEVRVISADDPEREATIMSAEWRDDRWWLEPSTAPYDGDSTSDFSWRELWTRRAC